MIERMTVWGGHPAPEAQASTIFPLRDSVADGIRRDTTAAWAEVCGPNSSDAESGFEMATHLGVWVTPLL